MRQTKQHKIQEISGLVRSILDASGLAERQIIASCWQNTFKNAAKHAKLIALTDGKLRIKVDSSVWLQQIKLMQEEIKEVMNRKLKKKIVKEIKLSTGDIKE